MQFQVIGWDGQDDQALGRRMGAREQHLAGLKRLKQAGHIILGGPLLDDQGKMIGSTLFVDFPDRAALDAWLASEPYVTGKVWEKINVWPMKVANID